MTQQSQTQTLSINNQKISATFLKLLEGRINFFNNTQNPDKDLSVNEFLSWDLKTLPIFHQLKDLEKSADKIIEVINSGGSIGIYGDYDVDGTTSCALFYHFFKKLNFEVKTYQPSRFAEGYGLHLSSIDKAIEDGIDLLITVDCGITNNDAAEYALFRGLDLIITDHHKDGSEEMPKAFGIVNPNRRDEDPKSEMKHLAGVGVAFALATEVRRKLSENGQKIESLYDLLPFVAVGTICDMAYLNPMNLKLVRHGLKAMKTTPFEGIQIFLSEDEKQGAFVESEKCSFGIGPMINSKGRLDHPEKALELLKTRDVSMAKECYRHLEVSNQERKFIQNEVFLEAKKIVEENIFSEDMIINIVYQPHWHEGVIGIVASKLVENYKVPAIVFTNSEEEGIIKASARSAGDLNIYDQLKSCSDLFIKFGGHKAAAGLSMKKENLEELNKKLKNSIKNFPVHERTVEERFDLQIEFEQISGQFVQELFFLEPYGMGNQKPIFKMYDFIVDSYQIMKDTHIRWNLRSKKSNRSLKGISFYYLDKWNVKHPEEIMEAQENNTLEATFTLGINRFRGNSSIQLMINKIDF